MHLTYIGPKKKKKNKKSFRATKFKYCVGCTKWIRTGQYYVETKGGKTRHAQKRECN